jgi:putative endonuclease
MNGKLSLHQRLHRQQLGKKGEDYAADYLQSKGYSILDRNFKASYGELDIVALTSRQKFPLSIVKQTEREQILVFVEVKTRVGREFGLPEEAVTPRKLKEIIKTAQYYILKHPNLPKALRIDVIGIEYDEQEHIVYFNHIENVTL